MSVSSRLRAFAQPPVTGSFAASTLLAVVSIYASDPRHWTTISCVWTLCSYSLIVGLLAGLWQHQRERGAAFETEAGDLRQEILTLREQLGKVPIVLPRVRRSMLMGTASNPRLHLLIEPSPFFATGLITSIYTVRMGVEVLIGRGRVMTVQEGSKLIQLEVMAFEEGNEPLWTFIRENEAASLEAVFVRPGHVE